MASILMLFFLSYLNIVSCFFLPIIVVGVLFSVTKGLIPIRGENKNQRAKSNDLVTEEYKRIMMVKKLLADAVAIIIVVVVIFGSKKACN